MLLPALDARRRIALRIVCLAIAALTLTACDKCGDSIFHADNGGAVACKGGQVK